MEIDNILVLGTGAWGTAISQVLNDNGKRVILYGNCFDEIEDINNNHKNGKYFGDLKLSENMMAFNNLNMAIGAAGSNLDLVIIALPSQAVESVLKEFSRIYSPEKDTKTLFINLSKGYDNHNRSMMEIFNSIFHQNRNYLYYSLLGPSHAEEVIVRKLTCVNLLFKEKKYLSSLLNLLCNNYFKVRVGYDIKIGEFCSSIKNVYALASGILSGIGYGQNARAALLTYSLYEMRELIKQLSDNNDSDVLYELCGIGDLVVTCYSSDSRNYTAGCKIGQLNSFEEFNKDNKITVEGIRATKFIYNIMDEKGLDLIIIRTMNDIISSRVSPQKAMENMFELVNNKI